MSVLAETERAVKAAREQGLITDVDAGTVAALLHLATEIDSLVAGVNGSGKLDNVSVPTFLKFSDSLGLTPTSRRRMAAAVASRSRAVSEEAEDVGGKLSSLRAVAGKKR